MQSSESEDIGEDLHLFRINVDNLEPECYIICICHLQPIPLLI